MPLRPNWRRSVATSRIRAANGTAHISGAPSRFSEAIRASQRQGGIIEVYRRARPQPDRLFEIEHGLCCLVPFGMDPAREVPRVFVPGIDSKGILQRRIGAIDIALFQ